MDHINVDPSLTTLNEIDCLRRTLAERDKKIKALEEEIEELKAEISQLEADVQNARLDALSSMR